MSFFSRALVVLGVLGGLGYGSYAFGKYVLSAHLFGPGGSKIGAVQAAQGGTLETPPQVDVERLPAADDSGASQPRSARRSDADSQPLPTQSPTIPT